MKMLITAYLESVLVLISRSW